MGHWTISFIKIKKKGWKIEKAVVKRVEKFVIYITGDTHCKFKRFIKSQGTRLPFALTEQDSMIICGDFGLL